MPNDLIAIDQITFIFFVFGFISLVVKYT